MRAPFLPSGSFAIWTMISWPCFNMSAINCVRRGCCGRWPCPPLWPCCGRRPRSSRRPRSRPAAARWILHARAEIVAHASLHLLLRLRRRSLDPEAARHFPPMPSACCSFGGMFGTGFFFGMRDHAFFFGRGFLLFEFGVFGIFCKAFRVVFAPFRDLLRRIPTRAASAFASASA